MGGVDLLSRVIISYNSQRRGLKWYRKLAELFFEVSVYNSYILWSQLNPDRKNIDNLKFRKLLIKEIISCHCHGQQAPQNGPTASSENPLRLTERHFVKRLLVPVGSDPIKYAKRCVRCYKNGVRKSTRYCCRDCNVALCIEYCFDAYHTKKSLIDAVDTVSSSDSSENDDI